jgi:hypothetical protein
MSVVPLAIAHAFVDKKSTSFANHRVRVVNLMDVSGADRMQKMLIVCRREDVRISNGSDVSIDSEPAFLYLKDALMRRLGVEVVFFVLHEPNEPTVHSSTEEFAYEYCLLEVDAYEKVVVDPTAKAAVFHVRFV